MEYNYLKPKETPVTYILVMTNIIVFVALEILGDTQSSAFMLVNGAMNPYMVLHFHQWYRLFTCIFLHFGIEHLANNMLLLFLLGQIFERAVGSTRYFGIYLGSGIAGSFLSFFYMSLMNQNYISAGASGAIFGIVGGMIVVIICHKGRYKWITTKQMIFMALLTLYFGYSSTGVDNAGHVGGLITGAIATFFSYGIGVIYNRRKAKAEESSVDIEEEKPYTLNNNDETNGQ